MMALLKGLPEQERVILGHLVYRLGSPSLGVGPQLKALLHEAPEMKHAVLQEVQTQWMSNDRLSQKSRYCSALFLSDLTLHKHFDV